MLFRLNQRLMEFKKSCALNSGRISANATSDTHSDTGRVNGFAFEWGSSVGKSFLSAYTSGISTSSGWQIIAISSSSRMSKTGSSGISRCVKRILIMA